MAAALAFVAAMLATLGLVAIAPRRHASGGGARRRRRAVPAWLRLLVRAGSPTARGAALPAPRELGARLDAAGRPGGLGERELMGAKFACALICGLAGALLAGSAPGRLGLLLAIGAPLAGFLGPDLWLARLARRRARRIRRELPAMLDLLGVTVQAGLSLPAALAAVGVRTRGPLAREWRALARETELGVPLTVAVGDSARRLALPEIRAFAGAVDRSARHGAPLAETLSAQARDARFALRRGVREEAARAGPKIQLVVALLLVPSVLLVVAAALVAALLGT
jgi:tight adherence protein C